jgi:hypothetical protein
MTKLMMIAALAATTAFATPAFASTTTAVSTTIDPVCTLTGPANNNMVKLTGGTSLGNVTVQCNDAAGFTASVSSANSGLLKDASSHSPTTFAYNLNFGAGGTHTVDSPVVVNSAAYGTAAAAAAVGGIVLPVTLNITAQNGASFAGTYSDVITWDITAN